MEIVDIEKLIRKKDSDSVGQAKAASFYNFFYLFWNFLEIFWRLKHLSGKVKKLKLNDKKEKFNLKEDPETSK